MIGGPVDAPIFKGGNVGRCNALFAVCLFALTAPDSSSCRQIPNHHCCWIMKLEMEMLLEMDYASSFFFVTTLNKTLNHVFCLQVCFVCYFGLESP